MPYVPNQQFGPNLFLYKEENDFSDYQYFVVKSGVPGDEANIDLEGSGNGYGAFITFLKDTKESNSVFGQITAGAYNAGDFQLLLDTGFDPQKGIGITGGFGDYALWTFSLNFDTNEATIYDGYGNVLLAETVLGPNVVTSSLTQVGTLNSLEVNGDITCYSSSHAFSSSINDTYLLSDSSAPEGVYVASPGSLYLRKDGTVDSTIYIKLSGTDEFGWAPVVTTFDPTVLLPITLDTVNSRVGINQAIPTTTLDVTGTIHSTGNISIDSPNRLDLGYGVAGRLTNAGTLLYTASHELYIVGAGTSSPRVVRVYDNMFVEGQLSTPTVLSGTMTTTGNISVTAPAKLDLGYGVVGRLGDAGSIYYDTASNELNIVGGGSATPRTVRLFDQLIVPTKIWTVRFDALTGGPLSFYSNSGGLMVSMVDSENWTSIENRVTVHPPSTQGARGEIVLMGAFDAAIPDLNPRNAVGIRGGFVSGTWGAQQLDFNVGETGGSPNDDKHFPTNTVVTMTPNQINLLKPVVASSTINGVTFTNSSGSLLARPIRQASGPSLLTYNSSTYEISYQDPSVYVPGTRISRFAPPFTFGIAGSTGNTLVPFFTADAGLYFFAVVYSFTGLVSTGCIIEMQIQKNGVTDLITYTATVPSGSTTTSGVFVTSAALEPGSTIDVFIYSNDTAVTVGSNTTYLQYSYI